MKQRAEEGVMVFPRTLFRHLDRFVPWSKVAGVFRDTDFRYTWLPRHEAEKARDWVQPIPCALIRNHSKRYLVLRRTRKTRADLRSRISLISGGHIDGPLPGESVMQILLGTLKREVKEEIGLEEVPDIEPIGVIVDSSSLIASRHIAIVFEIAVDRRLITQATEEYSLRSKFSGRFFVASDLSQFHTRFDPWSLLLYEDYIAPGVPRKLNRQTEFSLVD